MPPRSTGARLTAGPGCSCATRCRRRWRAWQLGGEHLHLHGSPTSVASPTWRRARSALPRAREAGYHVFLAHGTLVHDGASGALDDRSLPLPRAALGAAGYDYVALGHVHRRSEQRLGTSLAVYPGCVGGKGFDDPGSDAWTLVDALPQRTKVERGPRGSGAARPAPRRERTATTRPPCWRRSPALVARRWATSCASGSPAPSPPCSTPPSWPPEPSATPPSCASRTTPTPSRTPCSTPGARARPCAASSSAGCSGASRRPTPPPSAGAWCTRCARARRARRWPVSAGGSAAASRLGHGVPSSTSVCAAGLRRAPGSACLEFPDGLAVWSAPTSAARRRPCWAWWPRSGGRRTEAIPACPDGAATDPGRGARTAAS
jgi:hypothetical protein